jgi:hypothetical protein
MINSYAVEKGWLFSDLQRIYEANGAVVSQYPRRDASSWMVIRSTELVYTPDISRTVAQVHDMNPQDLSLFREAYCTVFTHPNQLLLWQAAGFKGRYVIRPIGTRRAITPAAIALPRPVVGFFCGENTKLTKGTDRFARLVEVVRRDHDIDVLMIGRGLSHIAHLGLWEDRAAGPEDYRRIDLLVSASTSPGVPLSVYEACAAGLPVVTTPRWFPGSGDWPTVMQCEDDKRLSLAVGYVVRNREKLMDRRVARARSPYVLEDWIEKTLNLARKAANAPSPIWKGDPAEL